MDGNGIFLLFRVAAVLIPWVEGDSPSDLVNDFAVVSDRKLGDAVAGPAYELIGASCRPGR